MKFPQFVAIAAAVAAAAAAAASRDNCPRCVVFHACPDGLRQFLVVICGGGGIGSGGGGCDGWKSLAVVFFSVTVGTPSHGRIAYRSDLRGRIVSSSRSYQGTVGLWSCGVPHQGTVIE